MTISREKISKARTVQEFLNNVTNYVKTHYLWHRQSYPTGVYFPYQWLDYSSNVLGPTTSELDTEAVSAQDFAQSFESWCKTYTRARKLRHVLYKRQSGKYYVDTPLLVEYDSTNYALFSPSANIVNEGTAYAVGTTGWSSSAQWRVVSGLKTGLNTAAYAGIEAINEAAGVDEDIPAYISSFNTLISNLKSNWVTNRETLTTSVYYYCHTNCYSKCHSNCHSRSRR